MNSVEKKGKKVDYRVGRRTLAGLSATAAALLLAGCTTTTEGHAESSPIRSVAASNQFPSPSASRPITELPTGKLKEVSDTTKREKEVSALHLRAARYLSTVFNDPKFTRTLQPEAEVKNGARGAKLSKQNKDGSFSDFVFNAHFKTDAAGSIGLDAKDVEYIRCIRYNLSGEKTQSNPVGMKISSGVNFFRIINAYTQNSTYTPSDHVSVFESNGHDLTTINSSNIPRVANGDSSSAEHAVAAASASFAAITAP